MRAFCASRSRLERVSNAMVVAVASRSVRRLFSISRTDSSRIWIGTWDSDLPMMALTMAEKKRRIRVNMAGLPGARGG